ncbi:MAG: hypothetical protein ACOYZ7_20440 [Chloroflexota bacterium]
MSIKDRLSRLETQFRAWAKSRATGGDFTRALFRIYGDGEQPEQPVSDAEFEAALERVYSDEPTNDK